MLENYQRVYASVDLDAVRYNMEQMHQKLSEATRMIGVIKTDGYGHGAVPIGRELENLSYVSGYAVATAEEAFILRKAGLKKQILILGHTFPYSYEQLIRQEISPAVFRMDSVKELAACACKIGRNVNVHVKVDTGMTRVGIRPDENGLRFVEQLIHMEGIRVEGLFTHFARADESDKTSAREQLTRFLLFAEQIETGLGPYTSQTLFQQCRDCGIAGSQPGCSPRRDYPLWTLALGGGFQREDFSATGAFFKESCGLCERSGGGSAGKLWWYLCYQ